MREENVIFRGRFQHELQLWSLFTLGEVRHVGVPERLNRSDVGVTAAKRWCLELDLRELNSFHM